MEVILLVTVFVLYALILCFGIAAYIVNAIGLSRTAKASEIKNPWLAWIPIADVWVLGTIADRIDAQRGLNRKWGKWMLTLYLIFSLCGSVCYTGLFMSGVMLGMADDIGSSSMMASATVVIVVFYLVLIAVALFATVAQVFYYICLYKIFEQLVPCKAVKYFVLSILIPLAMGICLMKACPIQPETEIQSEV